MSAEVAPQGLAMEVGNDMLRAGRLVLSWIFVLSLGLSFTSAAAAARPADPYVSRMTGVVGWITDTVTNDPYYVMEATVYVKNARKMDLFGYRVDWLDGITFSEGGILLPPANADGESVISLGLGAVPGDATDVLFASQVLRRGGPGGCCTPASPPARVTASLPERPALPPAESTWQEVFDVTFAAP